MPRHHHKVEEHFTTLIKVVTLNVAEYRHMPWKTCQLIEEDKQIRVAVYCIHFILVFKIRNLCLFVWGELSVESWLNVFPADNSITDQERRFTFDISVFLSLDINSLWTFSENPSIDLCCRSSERKGSEQKFFFLLRFNSIRTRKILSNLSLNPINMKTKKFRFHSPKRFLFWPPRNVSPEGAQWKQEESSTQWHRKHNKIVRLPPAARVGKVLKLIFRAFYFAVPYARSSTERKYGFDVERASCRIALLNRLEHFSADKASQSSLHFSVFN